jgi:uncharacterized membrane protein YkvA (DUF1232 family)
MAKLISTILERCDAGFPLWQKAGLTAIWAAYLVFPLDVIPDFVFPLGFADEALLLYTLLRVWASPTRSTPDRQTSRPNTGTTLTRRDEVEP